MPPAFSADCLESSNLIGRRLIFCNEEYLCLGVIRTKKHNKNRRHVIGQNRWYTMPFIVILLLSVVLCIVIMNLTYQVILNNEIDSSRAAAQQVIDIMEDTLTSAENLNNLFQYNKNIREIISAAGHLDMLQKVLEFNNIGLNYSNVNNFIKNYAVCLTDAGIIITDKCVYLQPDLYQSYLKIYSDFSWAEFHDMCSDLHKPCLWPSQTCRIDLSVEEQNEMLYTVPLIDIYKGKYAGQSLFYISAEEISLAMSKISTEKDAFSQMSYDDNVILQSGNIPEGILISQNNDDGLSYTIVRYNQGKMYLFEVASIKYNLKIKVGLPHSGVVQKCISRIQWVLICLGSLILLVLAVAIRAIHKNRSTLSNISVHLDGEASPGRIEKAIKNMKEEVNSLNEFTEKQKMMICDMTCRQLVHGFDFDEAEMEQQLEYVGIRLENDEKPMRAVYLQIQELNSSFQTAVLNQATLRSELAVFDRLQYLLVENRDLIALLYYDEPNFDQLTGLYWHLSNRSNFQVRLFVGSPFTQLHHARISFQHALKLLQTDSGEHYICIWEDTAQRCIFDYDRREEDKLITLIEQGNETEARTELGLIFSHNFRERHLLPHMRTLLYYRLISTLALIQCGSSEDLHFTELTGDESPEDFFAIYEGEAVRLCKLQNENRAKEEKKVDDDMISFLLMHYLDPNISITMVAQHFGYSESYSSLRLKRVLNKSFSSYIEELRIKKAKEYLTSGELNINEISQAVGYSSASVFGRAFKRACGLTPSEYQTKIREDGRNK